MLYANQILHFSYYNNEYFTQGALGSFFYVLVLFWYNISGGSMERINIGFDLGIASVGWSVYSVDKEVILDKGVKLFYQANKAEERRGHRALRRRYKRQKHRIERFDKLLNQSGISYNLVTDNDMLTKRINALNMKIDENDLINILRFFLKYRGYNPTADDKRDNIYKEKYPNKLACEIQKVILDEQGHYRGLEYPFMIEDFRNELIAILDEQSKHYPFISDDFVDSYFEIFNSRREFWEGPGGAKSSQLTPFGRYRNENDLEQLKDNPEYRKFLYQELIKDCSVYLGEKSVSKDNFYAQRFNFLNDMLNLKFNHELIKPEYLPFFNEFNNELYTLNLDGINLIQGQFLSGGRIDPKSIFKNLFEIDIATISGFRIDRDKKVEVTKFDLYNKVRREFENKDYNMDLLNDINEWNKLCEIKAIVPGTDQREQIISKLNIDLSDKQLDYLVKTSFTGQYHSFSQKALEVYIKNMEEYLINSSTLERKYPELINNEVEQFKVDSYFLDDRTIKMSSKSVDNLVASPQVKKTLRKAITTFNQIKKQYPSPKYIIDTIVIESNKDILSDQQKRNFESSQLDNEKIRAKARKEVEYLANEQNNIETLIQKYVLLSETNYKCIYCNDNVTIENMEIEHILPISKSADDSMNNKACACRSCNSNKGNKTPYQFLSMSGDWDVFYNRVTTLKGLDPNKVRNLVITDDINKYEKRFISRNLRDTAYSTKELNNQFRIYAQALLQKRNANEDLMFKVVTMPPQITSKVRRMLVEEKDRSQHYHHAFDASICAMYPTTPLGELSSKIQNDPSSYWKAEKLSEDIEKLVKFFKFEPNQIVQLKAINYSNTRMHTEVKQSVNSQLCNADINKLLITEDTSGKKTKTVYNKIEYISNIYELDKEGLKQLEKKLADNSKQVLGIKYNDVPTYKLIRDIYFDYKELKYKNDMGKDIELNPFVHYCCEQHDVSPTEVINNLGLYGIRPPSKKGKVRPVIKRLNYAVNKTNPMVFNKKGVELKAGKKLMLDSLSIAYTIVYKNLDKSGFLFLPVYSICCNLKTNEPNFDHPYMVELRKSLIGDTKVEMVDKFRTNDYVKVTKKNGDVTFSRVYGYHKSNDSLILKNGVSLTKSDLAIKKVPVYGLGIYNMNLDE